MKKIGSKKGDKQDGEENEMSFLEHIEELRWHLIRSIGAIFVFGIAVFLAKDLVTELLFAPRYNSFLTHRLLCKYFTIHCEVPSFEIITRELGEEFFVHLKSSIFLAVILTFPYLFWEIWRFVKPGLYEKEQKAARGIVFVCSSLFFFGVLFGYYIIAPFSISFLAGYSFGEGNADTATLGSYVGYITMITLPTGLVFELPIVAYFLGKVGLISSSLMKRFRSGRYFYPRSRYNTSRLNDSASNSHSITWTL